MRVRDYVARQIEWSEKTFGPGERNEGISDHIRKELKEIEADPDNVMKWIDVITLALDGAWRRLVRQGYSHKTAATTLEGLLEAKFQKNQARQWPDWRTTNPDKAIEHVRDQEEMTMRDELDLLDLIQDEIGKEAANIRNQFLMEGHKAREVRIGMLLAVSDLVMVAKRITEGEESDDVS